MTPELITPEELARYFHNEYERMAPAFDYRTREESAVPWDDLAPGLKRLMVAVSTSVLLRWMPSQASLPHSGTPERCPRCHNYIEPGTSHHPFNGNQMFACDIINAVVDV